MREKEVMNEKLEELAENYAQQNFSECTFTPQILESESV